MLRPNATYKMSKAGKTYLAVNWNRPELGAIKRGLIQAELTDKLQPRGRREKSND